MLRRLAAPALALTLLAGLMAGCGGGGGRISLATTTNAPPAPATDSAEQDGAEQDGADAAGTGADSVGDPVTPGAGNGGYDVSRYTLDISISDDRTTIDATTAIDAEATEDLTAFRLDLQGFDVASVEVDGTPARSARAGDELTITPAKPLPAGEEFTTVVTYSGAPRPVADPSAPGTIGWLSAPSGTFVAAEPVGAKGFFPCNDHPSDKALFDIVVTAPQSDTVIANGTRTGSEPAAGGRTRWTFGQTDPMATYLVQIAVGDYDLIESTGPHGLPIRHAVVRTVTAEQRAILDETAAQVEFFEPLFGAYPLDAYGLLVADAPGEFALETQTLTLLPAEWLSFDPASASAVMAHELAHQWFGNAVTPARWSDVWLNEGFATYGEWLWNDHRGVASLDSQVEEAMAQAPRWREAFGPVAEPSAPTLFSPNQYEGGAVVLHALRLTVGDDLFFSILRSWVERHDGGSATTDDFTSLASEIAGRDLSGFVDSWVRSDQLPPMPR